MSIAEPSEDIKKDIYSLYTRIYDSNFSDQKKKNLLTSIAGWEPWSWRVVGITANAVGEIVEANGQSKQIKSKLVRDHYFQSRSTTSNNLLKRKYNFQEYWEEFWNNDRTIIMTKFQHNNINNPGWSGLNKKGNSKKNYFEIEWELGYFTSNPVAGFHYSYKKEGVFIINNFKDLISKHKVMSGPDKKPLDCPNYYFKIK